MAKVVRLTESDLVNLVKRVLEEQTENFPDDDGPAMKQMLDSKLQGFSPEKMHSQSGGGMCKTAYKYSTSKGNVYLYLKCCGPKDMPSSRVGKCGHVVVAFSGQGNAPTLVKSFDINGFAMDSSDGRGHVIFDLDKGKLQKAIDYANKLAMDLIKKYGSVIFMG